MKSKIENFLSRVLGSIDPKVVKRLCVFFFTLFVLLFSWNSDDAFHSYVMVRNLASGNGFVYNAGYRVCASTCPLFTLIEVPVYFLTGNAFYTGILLGTLFSGLSAYFIVYRFCRRTSDAVLSTAILSLCYCFMCYTTSGLENSLLYLLGVLFLYFSLYGKAPSGRGLLLLSFLFSLIAMTRMDAVLLFAPLFLFSVLRPQPTRLPGRLLTVLTGMIPFFLWEIFSLIYYGYPFPNTFYIKLSTGFPVTEYLSKGLDYLYRSFACDILLFVLPVLLSVLSVRRKHPKLLCLSLGVILYLLYVISIGGDFMVGRHLCVPFLMSLCGIIYAFGTDKPESFPSGSFFVRQPLALIMILGLLWLPFSLLSRSLLFDIDENAAVSSVADERRVYVSNNTGTVAYTLYLLVDSRDTEKEFCAEQLDEIRDAYLKNAKGLVVSSVASGAAAYHGHCDYGDICITDAYGLMDPLLSHLPAIHTVPWRTGHMKRPIPEGYEESLAAGRNLIADPSLHEFYDKVLLIVSGDLFEKGRIRTILDMNLGKYDHLVDEYLERSVSREASGP
ncbi:MAG: glycosyltransferase family 39 protein [Lachnospiraceae bacterium]|nr:glycosyltransferase family 39 protein [Lachnospiraceae bacterium]